MSTKYTIMQVMSRWSDDAYDWVEDDRICVGEVALPKEKPIESPGFYALIEVEEIPLRITTELNTYGHRRIDIGSDDGQPLYSLVAQEAEKND